MRQVNDRIKKIKYDNLDDSQKTLNTEIFLHPMKDWRLRDNWENGVKMGGFIEYVRMFGIIGLFVLILACINFMNLSTAQSQKRAKEVGIRKVMGASVFNLWQLLSKNFVALVLISCFIAIPISYYLVVNWLENYEYRTEISWWIFAAAGFGALAITLLPVSFQAIKAATMNPMNSLRSE